MKFRKNIIFNSIFKRPTLVFVLILMINPLTQAQVFYETQSHNLHIGDEFIIHYNIVGTSDKVFDVIVKQDILDDMDFAISTNDKKFKIKSGDLEGLQLRMTYAKLKKAFGLIKNQGFVNSTELEDTANIIEMDYSNYLVFNYKLILDRWIDKDLNCDFSADLEELKNGSFTLRYVSPYVKPSIKTNKIYIQSCELNSNHTIDIYLSFQSFI